MRHALRQPSWRRFFGAHAQSCLGSGLAHIAMPLLAFDRTGSAWAIAAVLIPDLLPAILLGPVLGVLVDRLGWRACLIAADLMRCAAFGLMAVLATMPALIAAAALAGTGTALFAPAALTGIARLAPGDARPRAIGLYGALDDIGLTAGPALAALLLAGMPADALLGVNAVTFALSAVLIAGIRVPASPGCVSGAAGAAVPAVAARSLWSDVREGVQAVAGRPAVMTLLASSTAVVFCAGVTNIGEVVLAREVLGLGGSGLALLVASGGVGTILGSLAVRGRTPGAWRRAYIVGVACMAAELLLCAAAPPLIVLMAVFVLGGFGNGYALVHDRLLLGATVPDELHGRLFALQKAMTSFAFAASFASASVVIGLVDVRHAFLGAGVLMLAVLATAGPRLRAVWPDEGSSDASAGAAGPAGASPSAAAAAPVSGLAA